MNRPTLEICVDSIESLRAAREGGADRVELCAALALGGLTPSPGLIRAALTTGLPIAAMARVQPGGFVLSPAGLEAVLSDIRALVAAGVDAVVLGASAPDGSLDQPALRQMIAAAGSCPAVLHRAIDLTPDPVATVEIAIDLGFVRVLTSGGAPSAPEGCDIITRMVAQADGRIEIMAGGGVRPADIPALCASGVMALHGSASTPTDDAPNNAAKKIGIPALAVTQVETVRAMHQAITWTE